MAAPSKNVQKMLSDNFSAKAKVNLQTISKICTSQKFYRTHNKFYWIQAERQLKIAMFLQLQTYQMQ